MKLRSVVPVLVVLMAGFAVAEEVAVKAPVTGVGLFKNGLAVVSREVTVPGPGVFRLEDPPEPVHGTFWIESDAVIRARSTTRERPRDPGATGRPGHLDALVGRSVIVHLRPGASPVSGSALRVLPAPETGQPARFLVVGSGAYETFVDVGEITAVSASGAATPLTEKRRVLLFEVAGEPEKAATIRLVYLAKGMSWAPSYRVSLGADGNLTLEQKAVIRNELIDLEEVEVKLISGFPNVPYRDVVSPIAPEATLRSFFAQVSAQMRGQGDMTSQMLSQGMLSNSAISVVPAGGTEPPSLGDDVDIHARSIGKLGLAAGDSLLLPVASGRAAYERVVEWFEPDPRDARGRYSSRRTPDEEEDGAWDAVRFENPLGFPMTTAPATFTLADGRFGGQTLSRWVNAGERTSLRITKALSVRTRATEQEEEGRRDVVWIGGNDYRRATVRGTLVLENHRSTKVKMVVQRGFSGGLIEADGDAVDRLLPQGAWCVNERHELRWTIELGPGETRELTYRYHVLVDA